jgi:hypothetical protein
MPRTALPGGIGFHPNDDKWCLTGVIVTGMVTWPIRLKQQLCYLVCIQEINNRTQFYIVKRNFKIESYPPTPFMSKEPQAAAVLLNRGVIIILGDSNWSRGLVLCASFKREILERNSFVLS